MSEDAAAAPAQPEVASPPRSEKAQRLRLRFARGPEASAIGHLDVVRIWEGAFREAGIAVSYSEGARRQPRLTIGAGLPMGVTSGGELLDAVLAEPVDPSELIARLRPHLPPGLEVRDAWQVGMGLPSLPSAVRWADYEVDVPCEARADVAAALAVFLSAERFPWEDTRGAKTRRYDLRPLVEELSADARPDGIVRLTMRLRCDAGGVGRPDQVVKALDLPEPLRIHRERLVLSEVSPARDAWRRRGRYIS